MDSSTVCVRVHRPCQAMPGHANEPSTFHFHTSYCGSAYGGRGVSDEDKAARRRRGLVHPCCATTVCVLRRGCIIIGDSPFASSKQKQKHMTSLSPDPVPSSPSPCVPPSPKVCVCLLRLRRSFLRPPVHSTTSSGATRRVQD